MQKWNLKSKSSYIYIRADFRVKKYSGDKKSYYIIMKWSIYPEDIVILNVCVPTKNRFSIHEENMDRIFKNKWIHNYNWGFQSPTSGNI